MRYYFPSIIPSMGMPRDQNIPEDFMVDSGTGALRLLLRNLNLSRGSKVAIPAFVCGNVSRAVILEGLMPVPFDITDAAFWTDYEEKKIRDENIRAVIVVHLYGFIHPASERITRFCRDNRIKLIHDAAQSFGINESLLAADNHGIFYSFGPGKSSTACGGGWVKGISRDFYLRNTTKAPIFSFTGLRSRLFLKSRVIGSGFSSWDEILSRIIYKFSIKDTLVHSLGKFETRAAIYAMSLVEKLSQARRDRYNCIINKIKDNLVIAPAYDDGNGLYFKVVLLVRKDKVEDFKAYLKINAIPYFCLYDSLRLAPGLPGRLVNFSENAPRFIELSCEATIPFNEIMRVAQLLENYR